MAQRSHVPKFGNWESEEIVPYTLFFDKARKGRTGGKMINPNDPQENPDMFPNPAPTAQAPPSPARTSKAVPDEPIVRESVKPTHKRGASREDPEPRQFIGSQARGDNSGRRGASHGGRGSGRGRTGRPSIGSEHSIDRSPLHPHYQARVAGRGSTSPASEGKNNSYDSSHGTPGRPLRPRQGPRGETPDRGAVVPRFGDWDEKNPASADVYTHVFNRVREERHNDGSTTVAGADAEPSSVNPHKGKSTNDGSTRCCFL